MVDKNKIKPNSNNWIEKIGAGSGSKTEKQIDEIGKQLNRFLSGLMMSEGVSSLWNRQLRA